VERGAEEFFLNDSNSFLSATINIFRNNNNALWVFLSHALRHPLTFPRIELEQRETHCKRLIGSWEKIRSLKNHKRVFDSNTYQNTCNSTSRPRPKYLLAYIKLANVIDVPTHPPISQNLSLLVPKNRTLSLNEGSNPIRL